MEKQPNKNEVKYEVIGDKKYNYILSLHDMNDNGSGRIEDENFYLYVNENVENL